ncbi:unnamed protein product [Phytophthora fragariaefolia]|uniref:Unnamed protein product n=1 Tax=Phytophthora fragariaefolia TaxID=1490495 RepID=A0A9W6XN20_9STRA|nr:unnamed protein product [Phytophthora fragariaefolia]
MADFMSTNVIPVMDDLAKQILREKPNSVKGELGDRKHSNEVAALLADLVLLGCRPRFFPGTIAAVDGNRWYSVAYDDGKTESNVHYMCLKLHPTPDTSSAKTQTTANKEPGGNQENLKATRLMDIVLLIIGIDGAGKSTLLSTLQGDLDKEHVPSAGFTSATFQTQTGSATFYDLGDHTDAIEEEELQNLLRLSKFPSSKVVPCIAKPAFNGGAADERLEAGLQWLFDQVHNDFDKLHERVQHDIVQKKKFDQQRREEQRARVSRWKEERELNQMRAHDKLSVGEPSNSTSSTAKPEESVIHCSNCSTVPAVTKCAASKWMPVCEECATALRSQNQ